MPRRRKTKSSGLKLPPCDWPRCVCYDRHEFYLAMFERWHAEGIPPMTEEEKDDVLLSVTCHLACLAHNCCDPTIRAIYTEQLLRPVFDPHRGPWRNH